MTVPTIRPPHTRAPLRVVAGTLAALSAVGSITMASGSAAAQPAVTPGAASAPSSVPSPSVLPTTATDHYFQTPRDLRGCPFQTTPPPAVDASEAPQPGELNPTPPPVPATPAGGDSLGGCSISAAPGFRVPPEVTASGWIVTDLDSGAVLAARDAHGRYRPASIIKTLLAIVAIRELPLDKVVSVSAEDLADTEGSTVGVGAGGQYTVDRLLHGLLMQSGNDAALVLARQLGGVPATLTKMNDECHRLGCTDTHATSINGLDKPGQMTSAYDMALIFREALHSDEFARIVHTEQWGFPGYPVGPEAAAPASDATPPTVPPTPVTRTNGEVVNPGFLIYNDNHMLYNYPGALGGKTGFTDDARQTYIGAAERNGRRLAVVLLDGTRVPKAPWEQATALLDAGFATGRDGKVGELVGPSAPAPAASGRGSGAAARAEAAGPSGRYGAAVGGAMEKYGPWAALLTCATLIVAALTLAGGRREPRRPRGPR